MAEHIPECPKSGCPGCFDTGFKDGMTWRADGPSAVEYWMREGRDEVRKIVWSAECDCTRGPGEDHSSYCLVAPILAAIDKLGGGSSG